MTEDAIGGGWEGAGLLRRPISICFVAPQAYNVLSGDRGARHLGGAEVQQVVIGRALAARGHAVSFVTMDHGQDDGECMGGLRVFSSYAPEAGVRGLRFLHPRITRTWAAMARANADVYIQRTSDSLTGVVARFCRRRARRFIFSVGATADCAPDLPNCPSRRERWLYLYGLRRADAVVAQRASQAEALADGFGVRATVIPSAAADPGPVESPLPGEGSKRARVDSASVRVLWLGRFCDEKRPEWIADVARRCPDFVFVVIGEARDATAARRVRDSAAGLGNVRFDGYRPYHEMPAAYRGAAALLCTSRVEGFPNTFVEAWSRAVPVVTSLDPDGVVATEGLGVVGDCPDELADGLKRLLADEARRRETGARCRAYFLAHHSADAVARRWEDVLTRLVHDSTSAPAAVGGTVA